jgi:aspartyl-tRNA(Asn)/glutamyl-tRNA(Gln) amidotransferase subunit C
MTQPITEEMVRHIGKLSRIELSGQEVSTFARQLGDVLEYFDKLQELDTEGVTPMAHAIELTNVLADDTPREGLSTDDALANFFRVPKVLGEGS